MIDGSSAMDGVAEQTAQANPWRIAAPAAAVAVLTVLALYWQTVLYTVDFWERHGAYSHGFLLVPISLFLIWRERRRLARIVPRMQPLGLAAAAGLSLLWVLAYFVDVQVVMQMALLLVIAAVLWAIVGNRAFLVLAFPVGYLILGIPVWSHLVPMLQSNTAVASTWMLHALGVPVFLDGYYMNIPNGQFVVEEVCSGLRYLMAMLAIATLYAYLNLGKLRWGVLFVALAALLSIVFNWLRVMIIVYAGYASDMQHWLVKDHISFGWIVFAVSLVPIFALGYWLQRIEGGGAEPAKGDAGGASGNANRAQSHAAITASVIAVALAAVGPAAAYWLATPGDAAPRVELEAPVSDGPWRGPLAPSADWQPRFQGTSAELLAGYVNGGSEAGLYVAYYARQRQDAELVNESNALYDAKRWKQRSLRSRAVALAAGGEMTVNEVELVSAHGAERLLWYWYRMGDRRTTSRQLAKLLQLWDTVTGTPRGAVVAVSIRPAESMAAARDELGEFLIGMAPLVEATLTRAEGS